MTSEVEFEHQVILATNRIEALDPALIRPGRIDRKIEFPMPDERTKRRIFDIHTSKMNLLDSTKINYERLLKDSDSLTGADIKVYKDKGPGIEVEKSSFLAISHGKHGALVKIREFSPYFYPLQPNL